MDEDKIKISISINNQRDSFRTIFGSCALRLNTVTQIILILNLFSYIYITVAWMNRKSMIRYIFN